MLKYGKQKAKKFEVRESKNKCSKMLTTVELRLSIYMCSLYHLGNFSVNLQVFP